MIQVDFPERVMELLNPIDDAHPAGTIATTRDLMSINDALKKNPPDYDECINIAKEALLKKRKSIPLATRLTFAWFRKEKMGGLRDGLCLLFGLVKSFGDAVEPGDSSKQLKAIQFLEGRHFLALLKEEEITNSNAAKTIEVGQVFSQLKNQAVKELSASDTILMEFEAILNSKAQFAEKLLESITPGQEEKDSTSVDSNNETNPETKKLSESATKASETGNLASSKSDDKSGLPTDAGLNGDLHGDDRLLKIFSGDSESKSLAAMIEVACLFFEIVEPGKKEKVRRTPVNGFIYSLIRSIKWGKIKGINASNLKVPNKTLRDTIQEQFENEKWDLLIPKIELQMLRNRNDFVLWLDAQYYLVNALVQKGDNFAEAVRMIKFELAGLLIRFPQLKTLSFADDTSVPLASAATREWIEQEIEMIAGSSGPQIELMPVMGEKYQAINDEFAAAKAEINNKLENHLEVIQKNLDGDTRRKGRFLRKLSLANLCLEAKKYRLAKVHLSELSEKIDDYQLVAWEPALCVAVWQSTWLTNMKLIDLGNQNGTASLELEQDRIYGNIAKVDSVRAMKLANLSEDKTGD